MLGGRERESAHTMAWVQCKVCLMGSLGGVSWYRRHKCPEPFPPDYAQAMWDSLIGSGAIVHPETKARLLMSWRCGYAKSFEEREAIERVEAK